jgi:hypothetical protein
VLLRNLLRGNASENLVHRLGGLKVCDPRAFGSLLDAGNLGGILRAEELGLDVFRRLHIVDVGDEDALGFSLGLGRRLTGLR